jgi:hypothetical protein
MLAVTLFLLAARPAWAEVTGHAAPSAHAPT